MNDEMFDSEFDKRELSSPESQPPKLPITIDKDFARLVSEFIEEYREALKKLAE